MKTLLGLLGVLLGGLAAAGQPVPPEGEEPFDPRPLMAKVTERITTDKFRFAVIGDARHATTFPGLVKYLENEINPDFVLTTGDMVQAGGGKVGPGYWEKFAMDSGAVMRRRPWWPAIGNHEIAGSPIFTRAELDDDELLKKNQADGIMNFKRFYGLEKEYYSFDFRNALFIALPWRYPEGASEKWLEKELKRGAADGKHIFVFNHCPFFTVGAKAKKDIPNKQTGVTKMFTKYGARAVFSGHDHGYYRTVRGGITYVTSAGGGARIYSANRMDEALPEDSFYYIATSKYLDDAPDIIGSGRYLLRRPGKPDRLTEKPDQFMVVVDVDGASVSMFCVTAKGEKWEEVTLAR